MGLFSFVRRGRNRRPDGITAEDVAAGIEMILGRAPQPATIQHFLRLGIRDRFELGRHLIALRRLAPPLSVFADGRVLAVTHAGRPIYLIASDVDLTPSILLGGWYEPHVESTLVGLLRPGDTVVDLGANVGYHTLAMAQAVGPQGRVHAFEANPDIMRLLQTTMFINGFTWVSLYGKAATDQPGTITLASAPSHFGSGHLLLATAQPEYTEVYANRVEVEAVTLDADLADRVARVDLVHLDIEGAEPLALRGAAGLIERSPDVKIVSEWSVGMMGARADVGAFVGWLEGLGFRFWLIADDGALAPVEPAATLTLPLCNLLISRTEPPV